MHSIVMCTGASDKHGWVSFLRTALEAWYKLRCGCVRERPLYDHVISAEGIIAWHETNGTPLLHQEAYVKDMDHVRRVVGVGYDTPVCALDDRPANIRNGGSVAVNPYRVAIDLVKVCTTHFPHLIHVWLRYQAELVAPVVAMASAPSGFYTSPTEDAELFAVLQSFLTYNSDVECGGVGGEVSDGTVSDGVGGVVGAVGEVSDGTVSNGVGAA